MTWSALVHAMDFDVRKDGASSARARAYVLVICDPYVKTYSFRVVDEEGAIH